MKRLFSIHYEKFLLAVSLAFLAIVLIFLFIGIKNLIVSISTAINFRSTDEQVFKFNLEGAKNLNLVTN